MTNRILLIINTLALIVFAYWLYKTRDPEPLAACIISVGTLIGLIWKEEKNTKSDKGRRIKRNINSPISGKVNQQTINYFQTDPLLQKRIDSLEGKKINPNNMSSNEEKSNVTVNSYNQSGGITANQVNIGKLARTLNVELQTQLQQLLAENKTQEISITSVMGDGEAFGFATQIKNFLEQQGFIINGVNQAVYTQAVVGQSFNSKNLEIIIGTNQ